jgi:hypothetical protein
LFVEFFDPSPVEVELLGDIIDRRLVAAPTNEVGEPLGVKGIVGQKLKPLPPRFAKDASDLELKVYARVPARQIAYTPDRTIVPAVVRASAIGALRFLSAGSA